MKIDYTTYLLRPQLSDEARENAQVAWNEFEEKYGVKVFLKDGTFRPMNEWLDDLYLKFTTVQALYIVEQILMNGDIFFADIRRHRE